jgi:hypothetical protein
MPRLANTRSDRLLWRFLAFVFRWNFRFWIYWLQLAVSLLETTLFRLSEGVSHILGLWPCSIFPPQESAILVLGAGSREYHVIFLDNCAHLHSLTLSTDVGRNVTLRFSALGYTVFALCPMRHDHLVESSTLRAGSDVSSASNELTLFSGNPNFVTSPCSLRASVAVCMASPEDIIGSPVGKRRPYLP